MRPLPSRLRAVIVLLGGLALATSAGCSAATTSPTGASARAAAALVVVQGADQVGQAGRDLATPIVLRVVDSSGVGMAGVTITLAIGAGGGAVTPASDTTDAKGE